MFEKDPDKQAAAEKLAELFDGKPRETLITYAGMKKACGYDIRKNRHILVKAKRILEDGHKKTLECIRTKGYRVIRANEHGRIATHHIRKGKRQSSKAIRTLDAADETQLSASERKQMEAYRMVVVGMKLEQERIIRRADRHEMLIDGLIERNRKLHTENAAILMKINILEERISEQEKLTAGQ